MSISGELLSQEQLSYPIHGCAAIGKNEDTLYVLVGKDLRDTLFMKKARLVCTECYLLCKEQKDNGNAYCVCAHMHKETLEDTWELNNHVQAEAMNWVREEDFLPNTIHMFKFSNVVNIGLSKIKFKGALKSGDLT